MRILLLLASLLISAAPDTAAQASYERLREFWAEVAGKQRTC